MLTADDIIRPLAKRPTKAIPQAMPGMHRELAWFATCDDRLFGVLIEDRIDFDFSWVVLALDRPVGNYRAIDLAASCPSAADAIKQLRAALLEWYAKSEDEIAEALE